MPQLLFFGPLADITRCKKTKITGVKSTKELMDCLYNDFPELLQRKFKIAVNEKLVNQNTKLSESDVVALLPPFAGG
ncbi:MAG: hypothetical protein A3H98_03180 [Bacteroidetes bacterium RIFCSPLOWO2_02_FULL_36_8]|nr:MAG: hypothetical protein A3H98_03180 [Bacteroidetes bacterium RIFCSPLOWO2_02_FULL_36_8]OFY70356.1 MAG: hypothetical protein A3G23_09510 [Bacteroidetes bacterium RIFCSPLOWO2_12_FULL_37_12]